MHQRFCTVAGLLQSCAGHQTLFREDCMHSVASTSSFFFFLLASSVCVLCRLSRFNPQMLSNVVWACATMGFADDTAFIHAAAKAAIQLQEQLLAQVSLDCCMVLLLHCTCEHGRHGRQRLTVTLVKVTKVSHTCREDSSDKRHCLKARDSGQVSKGFLTSLLRAAASPCAGALKPGGKRLSVCRHAM